MICYDCKINQASFFFTQNINGKESSVALCKTCASKKGIGGSMVSPLFNSFFTEKSQPVESTPVKKCNLCALTFNDILSLGKVGCPECYNVFKSELSNTIRSIHGTAKHIGITPNEKPKKSRTEEDLLRIKLNEAINTENYEEAAKLRDQIKALKGDNNA